MTLLSCETLSSEILLPDVKIIMETRKFVPQIPGLWLGKPPKEVREKEKERRGEKRRKS